jgi:hypothetical protein
MPLKSAREVGFTQRWGELSEKRRLALRKEAGWKWSFPGESKEYHDWQEKRTAEIMDLYHYQERLDNWVQYTQIRSVKNFTELGFAVVDAPVELHARLRDRARAGIEAGAREEMNGKPQGIFGENVPHFVNHGERDILGQIQSIHEEWAPAAGPLRPVTSYGMRVYRRGASLGWHADRVDTHVISSIFHIDRHYDNEDEPWLIEIEGHDGKRHQANLKPGQMLLYESAKCPHGRSSELKGDWYVAVFSHFMPSPEIWPYTQQDIWLAVPPDWDAPPITHSGEGRWAGAFLTHDSMTVAGNNEPRDPKELHAGVRLRAKPPHIVSLTDAKDSHYQTDDGGGDHAGTAEEHVAVNNTVARTLKAMKTAHASAIHIKDLAASRAHEATSIAEGAVNNAATDLVNMVRKKVNPNAEPLTLKKKVKKTKKLKGGGTTEEIIEVVASGAISAVAVGLWCASGGTLVGLGLLCRRMIATKGRSLTRRSHLKDSA